MKTLSLIALACMCACASTPKQTAKVQTEYYIPEEQVPADPTELNLKVQDHQAPERQTPVANEEATYQASIEKITDTINRDAARYSQCLIQYDNKSCQPLLKELCAVDELIDSRSEVHKKPMCFPPFR
jgi:transglutaminase-like putative cysteine protease